MKNTSIWVLLGMSMLFSCSDVEEQLIENLGRRLQASFEQSTLNSRLAVGEANELTWTTDDAFAMLDNTGKAYKWKLEGEGGRTGIFVGVFPENTIKGALYPYSETSVLENNKLSITLPNTLTYDENGKCNLPMWASFTNLDGMVSFKHLGALLKVNFTDIPEEYNSLIVEADKPLSGEFEIDLSKEEPVFETSRKETGMVTVSFNRDQLNENDGLFYIPLPIGSYTFIKVSITNGTDIRSIATWNNKIITRKTVYVASLTCKESAAETPAAITADLNNSMIETTSLQLSMTGTVDATVINAGSIIIPTVSSNLTLSFENTPTTSSINPLKVEEESVAPTTGNAQLTIDIPINNTESYLELTTPNSTVNLSNGFYKSVVASTSSKTLIITKNVSIADLVINAGNVLLQGEITGSIKRGANNTEPKTIVLVDGGTLPDVIGDDIEVIYQEDVDLIKGAQGKLRATLDIMVSQELVNQGIGGEAGLMICREALADDMTWSIETYHKRLLNWTVPLERTNKYNADYWKFYYNRINEANVVLDSFKGLKKESESIMSEFNQIKGEMLSIRAWAHFNLVQTYADRYIAGTTNSQAGIQYRITNDSLQWTSSKVEDVYSKIKADLDEACSLLEGNDVDTLDHYSEKVVWGMKARVAMAMNDYENAITYASKCIELSENEGYKLMAGDELYNGFSDITTKTKEALIADLAEQSVYYYSFYAYMSWNFNSSAIRNGIKCINADTYALMSQTDLRRAWWDPTGTMETPSQSFRKFPYQNRKFMARATSDAVGEVAFMRLSEMYLTLAEAYVRAGYDIKAQEVFSKFQKTRDPEYVPKGNTGTALAEEIMNSRRIELWGEGFRFYDLKRLNLPIQRGSNFIESFCGFIHKEADAEGWTWVKPD